MPAENTPQSCPNQEQAHWGIGPPAPALSLFPSKGTNSPRLPFAEASKSLQAQPQVLAEVGHRAEGKQQECLEQFLFPATKPTRPGRQLLEETEARLVPATLFPRVHRAHTSPSPSLGSDVTISVRSSIPKPLPDPHDPPSTLLCFHTHRVYSVTLTRPVANLYHMSADP